MSFTNAASSLIEKHHQLQQYGACSIMLTHSLTYQILFSLIIGIIMFIISSTVCPGLDQVYYALAFIVEPITFSFSTGYMRYMEAENLEVISNILVSAQHLLRLLFLYLIFFYQSVSNTPTALVYIISQVIPQALVMVFTFCVMNPKIRLFNVASVFKFSHFKDFKIAITWKILQPTLVQFFYMLPDVAIYYPIALAQHLAEGDVLKVYVYFAFVQLATVVFNASEGLTRVFTRINLQVQRFDRVWTILVSVGLIVFLMQFCWAVIVLLAAEKLLAIISTKIPVATMKLASLSGMGRGFRTARIVSQAESVKKKDYLLLSIVYVQIALQIMLSQLYSHADLLQVVFFTELFTGFFDLVGYLPVLKEFYSHRKYQEPELPLIKMDEAEPEKVESGKNDSTSGIQSLQNMSVGLSTFMKGQSNQSTQSKDKSESSKVGEQPKFENLQIGTINGKDFTEFMKEDNEMLQ